MIRINDRPLSTLFMIATLTVAFWSIGCAEENESGDHSTNPPTSSHIPRSFGNTLEYACVLIVSIVVLLGVAVRPSMGQGKRPAVREYTIKAAYIYNFLRYIEWPSSAFENAKSPFEVGVLGEVPADLDRALSYYEKTKKVRGRAIKIRRFKRVEETKDCHVLFLTKSLDKKLLKEVVELLSAHPILLVGETSNFLKEGGGITFFIASNKVRIRVALKETQRKGLKPSAKLLQVAQVTN